MEKITIKDVARLADVSVATVSYIVNGIHEDRYTPDTKRKVLQIVNLYNYQPSRLAQSFALSKSRNVIILTDKHGSVLQKAESYDFLRLFCKTFRKARVQPDNTDLSRKHADRYGGRNNVRRNGRRKIPQIRSGKFRSPYFGRRKNKRRAFLPDLSGFRQCG